MLTGPGQYDLQSKLCLLTIAFPQVRIIWSMSPYESAEILEDLKVLHYINPTLD